MKRIFTLTLGLMMGATTLFAQEETVEKTTDLQFITINEDKEETGVLKDGATIETTEVGGLFEDQIVAGIAVKNVTDKGKRAQLKFEILEMDNGKFSCCFGGICKTYSAKDEYYVPALVDGEWVQNLPVIKAGAFDDLQSEWVFGGYGKCVVKFTVGVGEIDQELSDPDWTVYNVTEGPSITVTFINPDPTGINNTYNNKTDNTYYDLTGRKVANPVSGIYVKNGKKVIK